jgi:nitronate monooxygenase
VGSARDASATTAREAKWLAEHGCDAIIAQGYEAGGHRGMFLTDNLAAQAGPLALVPQVVDSVSVPVIAAGGIADGPGIAAAFALGASGVQIGTAYLFCLEANVPPLNRQALALARDEGTALTNLFTGLPARSIINRLIRELGPISQDAPEFPLAGGALLPLKAAAEAKASSDFASLWSGQAAALGRELPAAQLTRTLARDALERLRALNPSRLSSRRCKRRRRSPLRLHGPSAPCHGRHPPHQRAGLRSACKARRRHSRSHWRRFAPVPRPGSADAANRK